MKRFHMTEDGHVGPCEASVRSCPVGGPNVHFPSEDAARQSFELSMAGSTFSELKKPRSAFGGDLEEHLSRAKDDLVGSYSLFPGDPAEKFQESVIVFSYARTDGDKLVLVYPKNDEVQWDESLKNHLAKSALTSLAMKTCDEAGVRYEDVTMEGFTESGDALELTVSTRGASADGPGTPAVPLTAEKIAKVESVLSDKLLVASHSMKGWERKVNMPVFDEFDAAVSYQSRERLAYLGALTRTYNDLKDIAKDDRDPRLLRDKAIALLPNQPKTPKDNDQYQAWQAKYKAISEFLGELGSDDARTTSFLAAEPKEISWYYKD